MQPGLSDVARDVESDPGAVLDAHGADSIDDLVTPAVEESESGDDAAVAGLFEGSLSRPEPSRSAERSADRPADRPAAEADAPGVELADLERAIADASDRPEGEYTGAELADAVEDDEVATALADAEDVSEGDRPDVTFE